MFILMLLLLWLTFDCCRALFLLSPLGVCLNPKGVRDGVLVHLLPQILMGFQILYYIKIS